MASSSRQRSGSSASPRRAKPTRRQDSRCARPAAKAAPAAPKARPARPPRAPRAPKAPAAGRASGGLRLPSLPAGDWLRRLPVVLGVLAALAVVGLVVVLVLSHTPLFTIASVDTEGSEHVPAEEVARLADVAQGTTLLSVDADEIEANLRRNPWVASAEVHREFPDRLGIVVHEREVGYVVVMGTGGVCWYLGADGVWIEPAVPDAEEGQSTGEAAAQLAGELGCVLVTDVPADVDPRAGERVDDACVGAVLDYMDGFPEELASQVTQFSAASEASVSCGLESGVTVLLGEPTDISSKASVVLKLCETYQDQITYINVRTPSSPTFRRVDSENVQSSPEG